MTAPFTPPTPEQIQAFLDRWKLTREQALEIAGLPPGGGPGRGAMSYAVWFTLHAHMMLGHETIWQIEAAMRVDSGELLL